MAGSLGDLGGLLKQAQKMQRQVQEIQEDLAKAEYTGSAGGGVVKVVVDGQRQLMNLTIQPEVVDPAEVEMLEDLVLAAVSDALKQAEEAASKAMKGVTGGLGMPGMPGLM